jgi:hypothetical protein
MARQRVGLLASSAKVIEPAARSPLQVPKMLEDRPVRGPSGGLGRSHVKIGQGGLRRGASRAGRRDRGQERRRLRSLQPLWG